MHTTLVLLCLALPGLAQTSKPATAPVRATAERFVDPPGPMTAAQTQLLAEAKAMLTGTEPDPGRVLADGRFLALHSQPAFRALIRDHAPASSVTMVSKDEPGTRLRVTLTLRAADGKPITDLLVYAYHTSAKGWYAAEAAHVRAESGDHKHARLFAYVRTDRDGRAVLDTIRPGPYPDSDLPEHIHLTAYVGDKAVGSTELLFADDARVKEANRQGAERAGLPVAPVTRAADGTQSCVAEWRLRTVEKGSDPPTGPNKRV